MSGWEGTKWEGSFRVLSPDLLEVWSPACGVFGRYYPLEPRLEPGQHDTQAIASKGSVLHRGAGLGRTGRLAKKGRELHVDRRGNQLSLFLIESLAREVGAMKPWEQLAAE